MGLPSTCNVLYTWLSSKLRQRKHRRKKTEQSERKKGEKKPWASSCQLRLAWGLDGISLHMCNVLHVAHFLAELTPSSNLRQQNQGKHHATASARWGQKKTVDAFGFGPCRPPVKEAATKLVTRKPLTCCDIPSSL